MTEVTLVIFAIFALVWLRILVAFRVCKASIDALSAFIIGEIQADRADANIIHSLYCRLRFRSFDTVMFDLLVWTPRHANPWLFDLIEQRRAA